MTSALKPAPPTGRKWTGDWTVEASGHGITRICLRLRTSLALFGFCLVFVLVLIFDFFVDSASCFTWSLASCLLIASSLNRDVGTVVLTTYKANANSCISSTRDLLRHVDKRSSWELRKNTHKKYIEAKGWSRRERGGWQLAPMLRCTRTPELYFL